MSMALRRILEEAVAHAGGAGSRRYAEVRAVLFQQRPPDPRDLVQARRGCTRDFGGSAASAMDALWTLDLLEAAPQEAREDLMQLWEPWLEGTAAGRYVPNPAVFEDLPEVPDPAARALFESMRQYFCTGFFWAERRPFPRRMLLEARARHLLPLLAHVMFRVRRLGPVLWAHIPKLPLGSHLSEKMFVSSHVEMARAMERQTDLVAVMNRTWIFDPSLPEVSPHLEFIPRLQHRAGCLCFELPADADTIADALHKSRHRRELHRTGAWKPRCYGRIWARNGLLRWASTRPRAHEVESPSSPPAASLPRNWEPDHGCVVPAGGWFSERSKSVHVGRRAKLAAYVVARALGLFRVARFATRRKLRILAYHGLSIADEHLFRPGLFMRPAVFRSRMDLLARLKYPVLALDDALLRLRRGDLPAGATVLTIDDGFYGTYLHARAPLLRRGFPATLYATTWYSLRPDPIFRLAVQYMFWKSRVPVVDLGEIAAPGSEEPARLARDDPRLPSLVWSLIAHGERELREDTRRALCDQLARILRVDYGALRRRRVFALMTPPELQEASATGLDLQLHTHRHRLPRSESKLRREIVENRAILGIPNGRRAVHLAYPSNVWSRDQWPVLRALGIKSAATGDVGLNDRDADPLALRRFSDSDRVAPVEFEAELSGFADLLRQFRGALRRLVAKVGARQQVPPPIHVVPRPADQAVNTAAERN